MERLSQVLTRSAGDDQRAFRAAQIVAAVDDALHEVTGLSRRDAQAVSLRRDAVTVSTAHGAVAGIIYRDNGPILEQANKKLQAQGVRQVVRRLITRAR